MTDLCKILLTAVLLLTLPLSSAFAAQFTQPLIGNHQLLSPGAGGSCSPGYTSHPWVTEKGSFPKCWKCPPGYNIGPVTVDPHNLPGGKSLMTQYRCVQCPPGYTLGQIKGLFDYMYWKCVKP